jgi:hypothetical protein
VGFEATISVFERTKATVIGGMRIVREKTNVLVGNLPMCHFVHKSHMT